MNELEALFDRSWRPFRRAVGTLTDRQLDSPTRAGWTAKEMIGHLGFWLEATEPVIVTMLRGDTLRDDFAFASGYEPDASQPWPVADVHNAREAAWAKLQTGVAVIARLDAGHDTYAGLLASLRPDELDDPKFKTYVQETCVEFDAHRAEIEALLDGDDSHVG